MLACFRVEFVYIGNINGIHIHMFTYGRPEQRIEHVSNMCIAIKV